jgi:tripartite-type tricarboxylate transporter receptor subunit TctC
VKRRIACVIGSITLLIGCDRAMPSQDSGTDAQSFFRGRTVRILVGVTAGGGQDLYARIMAPYLSRHLAGQPNVIVENMPGAGGLIAATYLARRADADSLTIGLLTFQAVTAQLTSTTPAFEMRSLPIIGSPADDAAICVFARERQFSLEAWQGGRTPRMGMSPPGSITASYTRLFAGALALPVHPVTGYQGTSEIKAAMASGEIDGACVSRASFMASFQPTSDYDVVVQSSTGAAGLAGVPNAESLVGSNEARSLLAVVTALARLARFYAVPAGTPEDRVAMLRVAFDETMRDREFLASAQAARLEIRPQTPAEITAQIEALLTTSPEMRRRIVPMLSAGS